MKDTSRLLTANNNNSNKSELSAALSISSPPTHDGNKKQCKWNTVHLCWILLGIFLFIGSIQILWAPDALEEFIHDGIVDAFIYTEPRPNDENYQKWVSNDQGADSIPINVYIYFFNLTNPHELLQGEAPIFNKTEPIVYTQYYYRENITFSDDGTMARSFFKTKFIFDPIKSKIQRNETFTIVAPLIAGLLQSYASNPDPNDDLYDALFRLTDNDPMFQFTTDTAENLIFAIVKFYYPFLGIDFKYGMLTNNSGSWYISHTGHTDEYRMGEILKWSNQGQDEYHADDPDLINFDDNNHIAAECWSPSMPYSPGHFIYNGVYAIKDDPKRNMPPFFVSTLRKSLIFDYYKPVDFKDIPAVQYNFSTGRQLMNASLYPPNAQFYQYGPSGVMNMTACFADLPLFFSAPNFLGAPDFNRRNKEFGLDEPDPQKDTGFLQVEPMTGAILNADVPLQGNVPLEPIPDYGYNETIQGPESLTKIPKGIMAPTYLLRYEAYLPDEGAKDLASQIALATNLDHGLFIFGYICIGLFVLYFAYTWYWLGRYGYKKIFPGWFCSSTSNKVYDSLV